MTALAALQSVQYITTKGRRFAVVEVDDWEAMIEWLENQEDLRLVQQAYAELKAAGGNRKRAGWLKWDEVREEIT